MNFIKSNEYRNKIHTLIPGGAHTYSKGDDVFPSTAPAAISHGKGVYLWDLDGNKFLDCSMGLTSVSLGHAYEPVINRVVEELQKGVNFQRPSYIEREMAEKFLSLLPMHDMIKFAKNGSTATSAAVKLARAYTNKKVVAFPKEQPFFSYDDWFISKTACNKGIPDAVESLSLTYKFGDIESLRELFENNKGEVACVISEPGSDTKNLSSEYLKAAIELAHANGALYILDEMITGFKVDFPGAITKYDLRPDLATWGKGIANGFSFCALTGTKEIMSIGGIVNSGQEKVFLTSTTHGGETHSIAACLATIDVFENKNVIAHNHSIGNALHTKARECIKNNGLDKYVSVNDTDWWPIFDFKDKEGKSSLAMKTLIMQEMIKRGVLFSGFFVPSFSHTQEDVNFFIEQLNDSLKIYSKALEEGYEVYLEGPAIKPVFRKYV